MIRLVATDLDGTLVRSDGTISDRTVRALAAWEAAGGELVLVTGRPPRWLPEVADRLGHQGLAICANGALVYDLATGMAVERFPIPSAVIQQAMTDLQAEIPELGFGLEKGSNFIHDEAYVPHGADTATPASRLDDQVDDTIVKLLVRSGNHSSDELLAIVRKILGSDCDATHSTPDGTALVEISAAGVSKATTLATMCARRGIAPGEVLAFGDMPNDLPMLGWAGTSYAVANAHETVLAACTLHTHANDDDGVAVVVERLLPPPPPPPPAPLP